MGVGTHEDKLFKNEIGVFNHYKHFNDQEGWRLQLVSGYWQSPALGNETSLMEYRGSNN